MKYKIIKMRPSDLTKIRAKRASDDDSLSSLSGSFREALEQYGDGRARAPQKPEAYTAQVGVYADEVVFARAAERAKKEKRPIGEAVAEILLGADR